MRLVLTDRVVDLQTLDVEPGGRLTRLEGRLLAFLAEHPRRSFTTADLLREVWGYRTTRSNTVKSTVGRLRTKIEADPKAPAHLLHVRGVGYRFEPCEQPERPPVAVIGRVDELDRLRRLLDAPGIVSLLGPARARPRRGGAARAPCRPLRPGTPARGTAGAPAALRHAGTACPRGRSPPQPRSSRRGGRSGRGQRRAPRPAPAGDAGLGGRGPGDGAGALRRSPPAGRPPDDADAAAHQPLPARPAVRARRPR